MKQLYMVGVEDPPPEMKVSRQRNISWYVVNSGLKGWHLFWRAFRLEKRLEPMVWIDKAVYCKYTEGTRHIIRVGPLLLSVTTWSEDALR